MCTKEEFRQRVGMVNLNAITAQAPGRSWSWYRYGVLICFGKEDHECAVGIIYKYSEDIYDIFECWAPGIPPMDDNCIIFRDRNGNYIDEQDSLITDRALGALPRASGKMDGIILKPSEENGDSTYITNTGTITPKSTDEAPLPQKIAIVGIVGCIVLPTLIYFVYRAITAERFV